MSSQTPRRPYLRYQFDGADALRRVSVAARRGRPCPNLEFRGHLHVAGHATDRVVQSRFYVRCAYWVAPAQGARR